MSFELYCVEVEGILYYNYLTGGDYESVYERYEEYCEANGCECE